MCDVNCFRFLCFAKYSTVGYLILFGPCCITGSTIMCRICPGHMCCLALPVLLAGFACVDGCLLVLMAGSACVDGWVYLSCSFQFGVSRGLKLDLPVLMAAICASCVKFYFLLCLFTLESVGVLPTRVGCTRVYMTYGFHLTFSCL